MTMSKLKQNTSMFVFIGLLITIFISLMIVFSLIGGKYKFDLTDNKRFSLSPASKKILETQKSPLYIRVFLSDNLVKESPIYASYSSFVLRFLKQYQKPNSKLEVINPEPYSAWEDEAKKFGIKAIPDFSGQNNHYFGAVITDSTGKNYIIPHFLPARGGQLEIDISRIMSAINRETKPTVGIISPSLPLLEKGYGQTPSKWSILQLLENEYNVVFLSAKSFQIPLNIDVLVVINPNKNYLLLTYALDQYVLRGGRLLILNDTFSEYTVKHHNILSYTPINLNKLFQNWGFLQNETDIVGDYQLGEITTFNNGTHQQTQNFPFWMLLTREQINSQNPITAQISSLHLNTAGHFTILPETQNDKNKHVVPLLTTTSQAGILNFQTFAQHKQYEVSSLLQNTKKKYNLALLAEGSFDSAFTENILKTEEITHKMYPYLPHSIAQGKIIAIADSDILDTENWGDISLSEQNSVYGVIPQFENATFILHAIDYLAGITDNLAISSKEMSNPETVGETLYKNILNQYATEYNNQHIELSLAQAEKENISKNIAQKEQNLTLTKIKEIDRREKKISQLKQNLKQLSYKIKKEKQKQIDDIIYKNTMFLPGGIILFILLLFLGIRKHRRKVVKETFNA